MDGFHTQIKEAIVSYMKRNAKTVLNIRKDTKKASFSITKLEPKWIEAECSKTLEFPFCIVINARGSLKGDTPEYHYEDTLNINLVLKASIDLGAAKPELAILDVWRQQYKETLPIAFPLNDLLIPDLRDRNFEKWANWIIANHYPCTTTAERIVTADELAYNMGLTVIENRSLTEDGSVMARMIFNTSEIETYSDFYEDTCLECFQSGTILIDNTYTLQGNNRSRNNILFHECVHWALHRQAMALRHLIDRNQSSYDCIEVPETDDEFYWFEQHARAIAPLLHMPTATLKEETERILQSGTSLHDSMDILRREFDASMFSLKIRMRQLGYPVDGYKCYNNGKYSPPLDIKIGELNWNESYQVDLKKAFKLYTSDAEFRDIINSGMYIYVDDVYVLNKPENIVKDEDGTYHLSGHVKAHLRDNCLLFRTNRSREIMDTVIPDCLNADWLSSEEEIICLTMSCLSEEVTVYKEEKRLIKNLEACAGFTEFVTERRKELKLSIEKLSKDLCLGKRGAEAFIYGNGYKKITLLTLTYLCVILQLTPNVSCRLFGKTNIHWPDKDTKEESACLFILNTMWMKPIDEVRTFYNEMTK